MVLQQNEPVYIFGTGTPLSKIEISFQNKKFTNNVDEKGKFQFKIGPFKIDHGSNLKVSSQDEEILLQDVAVGEVWLCAGQSNMEFPMGYDRELSEEEKECPQNDIRYFDYPEVAYEGEINDADYGKHFGFWRKATKHDLKYFTAVGYYFAKKMQEKFPNTPIGLLACNWGGTLVSCWMSKKALFNADAGSIWQDFQDKIKDLDVPKYEKEFKQRAGNFRTTVFENQVVNWIMTGLSMEEIDQRLAKQAKKREQWVPQPIGPYFEWRPCGLFKTMLKHVAPFTVKGVLWYQGESDANYAPLYQKQLVEMIKEWRKLFDNAKLPFMIVQLAPFIHQFGDWGNNWPLIRHAQQEVVDTVANTGLVVITDSGMKWDIHPVRKRSVGTRLALQALNKVYGINVACEAPRLQNAELNSQKNEITLSFLYAYDGLKIIDHKEWISGLSIIQEGKYFDHLPVKNVCGNKVILDVTGFDFSKKMIINVAERDYYCMNIKNSAGIPARPGECEVKDEIS